MPSPGRKSRAATYDGDAGGGMLALQRFGWSTRDTIGFVVVAVVTIAVLVNVLALQAGPHPAPIFQTAAIPAPTLAAHDAVITGLPRPRPVEIIQVKAEVPVQVPAQVSPAAPPRTAGEIITDIQRELARRGYYDGAVDGRYGPKTDAAIRDFEQATGLKPSTEPNEALLRTIKAANARFAKANASGGAGGPAIRAAPVRNNDPIAEVLAPSKRVLAVQRALAEYGYGQIKPTGMIDPETQSAIEKFERERRLPITGTLSDRLVRELASLTGRPLE